MSKEYISPIPTLPGKDQVPQHQASPKIKAPFSMRDEPYNDDSPDPFNWTDPQIESIRTIIHDLANNDTLTEDERLQVDIAWDELDQTQIERDSPEF
jgi:hypothetical protein